MVIAKGNFPAGRSPRPHPPAGQIQIFGVLRTRRAWRGDGLLYAYGRRRTRGVGRPILTTLLLDTHVWASSLTDDQGAISDPARRWIAAANSIVVSAISFFEIAQETRASESGRRWRSRKWTGWRSSFRTRRDGSSARTGGLPGGGAARLAAPRPFSTGSWRRPRFGAESRSCPPTRSLTDLSSEFGDRASVEALRAYPAERLEQAVASLNP